MLLEQVIYCSVNIDNNVNFEVIKSTNKSVVIQLNLFYILFKKSFVLDVFEVSGPTVTNFIF